jgi:RecA-family ATPase
VRANYVIDHAVANIIIPSAHRAMIAARPENKRRVFELQARALMSYARKGTLDHADATDALQAMADESGLTTQIGQDEIQAIMADAADDRSADDEIINGHSIVSSKQPDAPPFEMFDAGDWEGVPIEPRRWTVRDRIPAGEPGIISGDGGTGKTKLMLQLCVAVGAEQPDWIGGIVETHGPAMIFSPEEKLKEMHRRVADIIEHRGLSFSSLRKRVYFIDPKDDAVLATGDEHKGTVTPTRGLLRLEKSVEMIRPALLIIENAADVYAGNENNRTLVARFVRKHLGNLAQINGAAVGLIQHPSVSGLQDGTGRSGTTGWNNSGRWRLNFTKIKSPDNEGARELEVVKSNYGPQGERVLVRWERGVFVPEGSGMTVERAAAEAAAEEAFLRCLDERAAQGINATAATGTTYAPSQFENMRAAHGNKKRALTLAMERLLSAGRIKVEETGPPSKRRTRLVRA